MAYKIKQIEPKPEFDIFFFMELHEIKRMENDLMLRLEELWNKWLPHIRAYMMGDDKDSFLLLHLTKDVDAELDDIWAESPADGLAARNLAITMLMTAAQDKIPQLADGQCAPVPEPMDETVAAFASLGLELKMDGTLDHQFAVFTHHPHKGSCEVCYLQETCPNSRVKQ